MIAADRELKSHYLIAQCFFCRTKKEKGHCINAMRLVGEGTFGKVYQVGKTAIKICQIDETCHQRELEICEVMKTNPHTNIVKIITTFVELGNAHIVMEYVAHTLQTFLGRLTGAGLRMKLDIAKGILHGLASALMFLRTLTIVHRDIKPSNILIRNNECKLCDFGSAKKLCDEANTTYIVTRFYRAPELILDRYYSFAVDMWSFGCVAAELTLGQPLFQGSDNVSQLCEIIRVIGITGDSLANMKGLQKLDCVSPSHKGVPWKRVLQVVHRGRACNVSYGRDYEQLLSDILIWDSELRPKPNDILTHKFIAGPAGR